MQQFTTEHVRRSQLHRGKVGDGHVAQRWAGGLATCADIDLNPVAAGLSVTPETSPHTSVHRRVEHADFAEGMIMGGYFR